MINLETCTCNKKQPLLICFYCWGKGVRFEDREKAPKISVPVVPGVEVLPLDESVLRLKITGALPCTCPKDKTNCPTHKEFYGTKEKK